MILLVLVGQLSPVAPSPAPYITIVLLLSPLLICLYLFKFFCHYAAVVTAVTELGHGKPKFYSTPEVIAFCRKWRLPTNHVWLFSTRCPSITLCSQRIGLLCFI